MEAGVNLLGKVGCRYPKEHVCKISGQYIHFHRSYDSFCNVRTLVLIYRPHPVQEQYSMMHKAILDDMGSGLQITGHPCSKVILVCLPCPLSMIVQGAFWFISATDQWVTFLASMFPCITACPGTHLRAIVS